MERHNSQRGYFAYELHQQMAKDPDIWCITADCKSIVCMIEYKGEKEWI